MINHLVCYRNLNAGFTRIQYLGVRKHDRAEICYIELVNNSLANFEQNEE